MESFELLNENGCKLSEYDKIYDPQPYNCPECQSLIEILSIDDDLDKIEYRCFNKDNFHTNKMEIKEYLQKIKSYDSSESIKIRCNEHNQNSYEYFCLNCNQHLCRDCLKSRNHIFHPKINIMKEIALNNKEIKVIEKYIGYDKNINIDINNLNKTNNSNVDKNEFKYIDLDDTNKIQEEKFKDIKELIYIVYDVYKNYQNNYYMAINLFNLIISCYNNKEFKNDLEKEGFKKEGFEKLMKIKNEKYENTFEKELKSILNECNTKIEKLSQKFNKEIVYKGNTIIKKVIFEKLKQYKDGIYIGEFKNEMRDGRGKFIYKNGDIYEGDWKNDKKEGKGIFHFNNGNRYEGDFKNNKIEGKGIFYVFQEKKIGDKYEGDFKEGKFDGFGIYFFKYGGKQIGYFSKNTQVGKHIILTENNDIAQIKNFDENETPIG